MAGLAWCKRQSTRGPRYNVQKWRVWVTFKLACLVYQSLCGNAPRYLADDIHLMSESDCRQLRSSSARTCIVPRTHNSYAVRWQEFCCNRTASVEQPTFSSATFWHWLQRLQTPTENVTVWIDCSAAHCDFSFMCALYILLLTYLLTNVGVRAEKQMSL